MIRIRITIKKLWNQYKVAVRFVTCIYINPDVNEK